MAFDKVLNLRGQDLDINDVLICFGDHLNVCGRFYILKLLKSINQLHRIKVKPEFLHGSLPANKL